LVHGNLLSNNCSYLKNLTGGLPHLSAVEKWALEEIGRKRESCAAIFFKASNAAYTGFTTRDNKKEMGVLAWVSIFQASAL
jgi:hypothetical protein